MPFVKYPHIEQTWKIEYMPCSLDVECIAAVKIDGCNFQAGIDEDGTFFVGTRNTQLKADDNFYRWQYIMQKLDVEKKLRSLKAPCILYGELCGGLYRHPDVQKVDCAVRIQGRVDYSPDNEWVPFDLMLNGEIVSQDRLAEVCQALDLPCQEVKFRGTLQECLDFSPVFLDETGHRLWGLPLIDGNVAEGLVIKPINCIIKNNGERVIFKNKNPKFKERIKKTKSELKELNGDLTEYEEKYAEQLEELCTVSRAASVVSKLVMPSFGDAMSAFIGDVFDSFYEELSDEDKAEMNTVDPKELDMKKIRKRLNKSAADVVREVWLSLDSSQRR
jgi:Rnl2 family RNA ligase